MSYKIYFIISIAIMKTQIISTQYIANGNFGPALRPNPGSFALPMAYGSPVPFLAGPALAGPSLAGLSATVAAPVSTLPAPNTVAAPVSATFAAPTNVAAPVSATFAAPTNVAAPVSATFAAPTNVAAPVSATFAAPTTVAAPVSATFAAPTTITAPVSATFANSATISNTLPVSLGAANFPSTVLASSAVGGISAKPTVLAVTSVSPIAPNGISVNAENIYLEGPLAVSGQLPYLGTVALEGSLASSGSGVAKCGCGNGEVGIISEGFSGLF